LKVGVSLGKFSNIKFYSIHPVGAKCHAGQWTGEQKDRHDEANIRFLQFCRHT